MLDREEGAASTLRQLGATVRTLDLWDDPVNLIADEDDDLGVRPRALVFEALDRPDLALAALRAVRKEPYFDNVGAIIAVTVGQIARIEPSTGFDDFVLHPYVPEELYGRIVSNKLGCDLIGESCAKRPARDTIGPVCLYCSDHSYHPCRHGLNRP